MKNKFMCNVCGKDNPCVFFNNDCCIPPIFCPYEKSEAKWKVVKEDNKGDNDGKNKRNK